MWFFPQVGDRHRVPMTLRAVVKQMATFGSITVTRTKPSAGGQNLS
jgi:hypothetical protein